MSTPLHLWGRLSSLNVRKVVWVLQELGLPFQRTDAGAAFGLNNTPDYLAMNPNALVPLLEDGGLRLWESNVIVRYLCARYAPETLYPMDLAQRFDAERWMDWQQTTFNPAGRDAFVQLVRTPVAQRDTLGIAQSVQQTEALLQLLDQHLTRQPYLAGAHFGMADIPMGCEMHRWWGMAPLLFDQCGVQRHNLGTYPHVRAWFARIATREAARGVLDQPLS